MEPVRIVYDRLWEMAYGFLERAPQLAIALVVLVLTWLVSRATGWVIETLASRSKLRRSLVELFKNLASSAIWILGVLIAITIAFPSITPSKALTAIGLGSIAIGFAFKDVFENFLAGILILYREPMRIGDHIQCSGVEGKVERISIRDTHVRQTDGQLVVMPNAMLFKDPVYIRTDQPYRRVSITAGIAYGEDVAEGRKIIEGALQGLDTVAQDRPIQIFAKEFNSSSIDFEVTWWTGSTPLDERRSRDQVVEAVKAALDDAGIEIPFPYRTLTFKEPLQVQGGDAAGAAGKKAERKQDDATRRQ